MGERRRSGTWRKGGGSVAGPEGAEGFKRGTPLDEATAERREEWLTELQKQGR